MSGKHAMEDADSSSDAKRSKRSTQQGGITMNSGDTKDGYGHGIYEIEVSCSKYLIDSYLCNKIIRYLTVYIILQTFNP